MPTDKFRTETVLSRTGYLSPHRLAPDGSRNLLIFDQGNVSTVQDPVVALTSDPDLNCVAFWRDCDGDGVIGQNDITDSTTALRKMMATAGHVEAEDVVAAGFRPAVIAGNLTANMFFPATDESGHPTLRWRDSKGEWVDLVGLTGYGESIMVSVKAQSQPEAAHDDHGPRYRLGHHCLDS